MILSILLVFSMAFVGKCQSAIADEEFNHSLLLNNEPVFTLRWNFNDSYIIFKIEIDMISHAWFGFGISRGFSMAGSDIYMMWIIEDMTTVIWDMHATKNGAPILDAIQNLDHISTQINNASISFVIGRGLCTCDADDVDITEDSLRVLFAFGENVPGPNVTLENKHSIKGSKSVQFLNQNSPLDVSTTSSVTIAQTNVTIPPKVTYYHCLILPFRVPSKVHVVAFENEVDNKFAHHMVLYMCIDVDNFVDGHGRECFQPTNPDEYWRCQSMVLTWAIGGKLISFPDDAGLLISNNTLFLLEVHYNNPSDEPKEVAGSTGIRLYYTSSLRHFNMAQMEIGQHLNPLHSIPSGIEEWQTIAQCPKDCLAQTMVQSDVSHLNVVAVMLHSHVHGRRLILRHIRNGMELRPITTERYYDFNYQDFHKLTKEVRIYPGDTIIMECVYNTVSSGEPVYSGIGTQDEMCLAYLLYYPSINVTQCHAHFNITKLANVMDVSQNDTREPWGGRYKKAVPPATGFAVRELNKRVNAANTLGICTQVGASNRFKPPLHDQRIETYTSFNESSQCIHK